MIDWKHENCDTKNHEKSYRRARTFQKHESCFSRNEARGFFHGNLKNKKLSFVDTSLLHLAREYDIITFDKDLEKEIRKLE
ncbi:hypothetical protein L0Y69_00980 [bacterium]|nr:hypothetical protein [bacterium]